MNRWIKKWILRLTATVVIAFGLLLIIVLNPVLTYANKTRHKTHTIFHNRALDKSFLIEVDHAIELLAESEFYNPELHLDIMLSDGSIYPELISAIRGQAFAWGFYNKVVLQGTADYEKNYVELNSYKWNLTQLLAHEMTHCLQFDKLGFWKSNPIANIPVWKWEGYAEYISRQNKDQKDLAQNIEQLIEADKSHWGILFEDSTVTSREYYTYWILVQYCMDIRKMSYQKVLSDTTSEPMIRQEMMHWFNRRK